MSILLVQPDLSAFENDENLTHRTAPGGTDQISTLRGQRRSKAGVDPEAVLL